MKIEAEREINEVPSPKCYNELQQTQKRVQEATVVSKRSLKRIIK
jgi:hypothetical protein